MRWPGCATVTRADGSRVHATDKHRALAVIAEIAARNFGLDAGHVLDALSERELAGSTGVGHALIAYMEKVAKEGGCDAFTLDSGTQREQAHKFYFREGMTVTAYHFTMKRKGPK